MTILSPEHMTIPTNTVCNSKLIYIFIQTQHQLLSSFSTFELYSTHCSHHGFICSLKSPISLSGTIFYFYTELLVLHSCLRLRGNLVLYSNSLHSLHLAHTHLVQAVTAASHPQPELTLSSRYVNSFTVST